MAAESAPPEQMATAIGWVQTAQRLGPALGPVIGGTLAHAVGLRGAFLVSAAVYLAAFLLVLVGYREKRHQSDSAHCAPGASDIRASLRPCRTFCCSWARSSACSWSIAASVRSFRCICGRSASRPSSVPFLAGILFTVTAGSAAIGNQSEPAGS